MGWRGTLRALGANARRRERAQRRWLRDLEQRRAQNAREAARAAAEEAKAQERAAAELEVEIYEARLATLNTVHRECADTIPWRDVARASAPPAPTPGSVREDRARASLIAHRASIVVRLFGTRDFIREQLEARVEAARAEDEAEHTRALAEHREALDDWREEVALARRVLAGDLDAYGEVAVQLDALEEIAAGDADVDLRIDPAWPDRMLVNFTALERDVVPSQVPSVTQRGKLSVKPTPASTGNEIYQDYVCGAAIRIARELLAAVPIESVIVNVLANRLSTSTGHLETVPVLAAAFPRATVERVNWELADASDSMRNFPHRMKFKRSAGMEVVQPFDWDALPR